MPGQEGRARRARSAAHAHAPAVMVKAMTQMINPVESATSSSAVQGSLGKHGFPSTENPDVVEQHKALLARNAVRPLPQCVRHAKPDLVRRGRGARAVWS